MTEHRGVGIPYTVKAWRAHAYIMADLVEAQRAEINKLKQTVNTLRQKARSKSNKGE